MKRWVTLLLVAIVAGFASFLITRQIAPAPAPTGEIAWLTTEFNLNPAQSQKVQALHDAYLPICAQHCAAILETRGQIETAANSAEKQNAETALQQLVNTCHDSTRAHLQAVAKAMDPAQAQRYLAMIGPRLSAHQHAEPFGLR